MSLKVGPLVQDASTRPSFHPANFWVNWQARQEITCVCYLSRDFSAWHACGVHAVQFIRNTVFSSIVLFLNLSQNCQIVNCQLSTYLFLKFCMISNGQMLKFSHISKPKFTVFKWIANVFLRLKNLVMLPKNLTRLCFLNF